MNRALLLGSGFESGWGNHSCSQSELNIYSRHYKLALHKLLKVITYTDNLGWFETSQNA